MKPVLIVDDEAIVRESLKDWLSEGGFTVLTVESGEQGLKALETVDFGVVVLDLRLPGKDGLEVLREARAQRPHIKGIIITAYPTVDTAVEGMKLGALDYLVKPFSPDTLENLIREALGPLQAEIRAKAPVQEAMRETPGLAKVESGETIMAEEGTEIVELGPTQRGMAVPRGAGLKQCVWMKLGVISYKLCAHDYDCLDCEFERGIRERIDRGEVPDVEEVLKTRPGSLRLCRYALKDEVSYRTCSRLYQCAKCEFGQWMEDALEQKLASRQEAEHLKMQTWWWPYWGITPQAEKTASRKG